MRLFVDLDSTHLSSFLYLHSHQYLHIPSFPAPSGSLPPPSSPVGNSVSLLSATAARPAGPEGALRWLNGQGHLRARGCLASTWHVVGAQWILNKRLICGLLLIIRRTNPNFCLKSKQTKGHVYRIDSKLSYLQLRRCHVLVALYLFCHWI